jgi:flavin reductase (DIM6/NTAB) family NADH-FMN oxidoreductase RutF
LEDPAVKDALKEAMRAYPQGVTVVTTDSPEGPRGITVSSFTSVSLSPPLILISIARSSALHDTFASTSSFAVNFLADDQKTVSDRFAGRLRMEDRFEGLRFTRGKTGSPVISGTRAVIECRAWKVYDGGDHSLIVGEVVAARTTGSKRPLVYFSQRYTTTETGEAPAPPSDMVW